MLELCESRALICTWLKLWKSAASALLSDISRGLCSLCGIRSNKSLFDTLFSVSHWRCSELTPNRSTNLELLEHDLFVCSNRRSLEKVLEHRRFFRALGVIVKSLRRSLKNDDLTLKQIFYTSVSLKTSNFGHSLGQKLTCDSRIAVLRKVQSRILCFPRTNKRLKPRRNSLLTIE